MKLLLLSLGIVIVAIAMTFLFSSAYIEYVAWKTKNLIERTIKEDEEKK